MNCILLHKCTFTLNVNANDDIKLYSLTRMYFTQHSELFLFLKILQKTFKIFRYSEDEGHLIRGVFYTSVDKSTLSS